MQQMKQQPESELSNKLSLFKKYFYEICFFTMAMAVIFLFKELNRINSEQTDYVKQDNKTLIETLNNNTEALKSNSFIMYEIKEMLKEERQKNVSLLLNNKK